MADVKVSSLIDGVVDVGTDMNMGFGEELLRGVQRNCGAFSFAEMNEAEAKGVAAEVGAGGRGKSS